MKKNLLFIAILLCCAMSIFAQNNKISYQAVVRDAQNQLVVNKTVEVTVSIFNGTETTAAYTETHTNVQTNFNGLLSLQIGGGTATGNSWAEADIDWKNASVTTAVSLDGTQIATLEMPLTAVPYTLYADYAEEINPDATVVTDIYDKMLADSNALSGQITTMNTNLTDEINNLKAADNALSERIANDSANLKNHYTTTADLQSNYYNKTETYSQSEVNTRLGVKANVTDVYTKTQIDAAKYVSNASCDSLDFCDLMAKVNGLVTNMTKMQQTIDSLEGIITELSSVLPQLSLNADPTQLAISHDNNGDVASVSCNAILHNADGYTIHWKVDGTDSSSTNSSLTVKFTETGTHKVLCTATKENFSMLKDSVTITVTKGTPTVTAPTALNLTYSGEPQDLVTAGTTTGGTLQYKLNDGDYSTSIPQATNAGNYTVYYKVVGNDNWNDVDEASVSVTIGIYVPTGAINGMFTVSNDGGTTTSQVYFSRGNLQATYNGSSWTWAFAANQWDYIGDAAGNTKVTESSPFISENATVDLFCWVGASSTWDGVNQYGITASHAVNNTDGYGNVMSEPLKSDWGTLAITNGGNTANSGWRTLTDNEWIYIFNHRNTTSGVRYALATVNGEKGVILLPDDWSTSYHSLTSVNNCNSFDCYSSNIISYDNWMNDFEAHGAVFLPAAGYRSDVEVINAGYLGVYWSSASYENSNYYAYLVQILAQGIVFTDMGRSVGSSVRLVRPVE